CAATQHGRAGTGHARRRLRKLHLAFDRAWTGHDDDIGSADFDAARLHDRLLAAERAAGELERLADPNDFLHAVEELEFPRIDRVDVADDAEDALIGAGGAVDVESA